MEMNRDTAVLLAGLNRKTLLSRHRQKKKLRFGCGGGDSAKDGAHERAAAKE